MAGCLAAPTTPASPTLTSDGQTSARPGATSAPATATPATAAALTDRTETTPRTSPTPVTPAGQNVAIAVTTTPEQIAQRTLARMSLEQKVGQVFMLGFDGTTLNDANRALIQGLHLGGVTLFGRNIESAEQLARLDHDLQSIADPVPLFISVDQEGGLGVRVTDGATVLPGNMAVGDNGGATLARPGAA